MTLISIFIRDLKGKNTQLYVSPEQLVRSLTYTVSQETGLNPSKFYLTHRSKILDNEDWTLAQYDIGENSQIEMSAELAGGFGMFGFRRRPHESFITRIIRFIKKFAIPILAGMIFIFVMVTGMVPFVANFFYQAISDFIYRHTLIPLDRYLLSIDNMLYYLFMVVIYYIIRFFEFLTMLFVKVWVNQLVIYSMASCVLFLIAYTMTRQKCYSLEKAQSHAQTVSRIYIFIYLFQMIPFFGNWIRTQPSPEGPIFDELLFGITNPGYVLGEGIEAIGMTFNDFSQVVCGSAGYTVQAENLLSMGDIGEDMEEPGELISGLLANIIAKSMTRMLNKYIKPMPFDDTIAAYGGILGRIIYPIQWGISLIICTIFSMFQQYGARDITGYFNLQKTLDQIKDASFAGFIGVFVFGILALWMMFNIRRQIREAEREAKHHNESTTRKIFRTGFNVTADVVDPFRLL